MSAASVDGVDTGKIAIFGDGSFKDILYFVPETLIVESSRYEIPIETNKLQSSFFLLTIFINPSVAGSISLRLYDTDFDPVNVRTIPVDERADARYKDIIRNLKVLK